MFLNDIFQWNSLLLPPLGIILNVILVWAILCRTPNDMHIHCRGLILNCFLAISLFMVCLVGIPIWTVADIDASGLVLIDGYLASLFWDLFDQDPMQIWNFFICWHFLYLANQLAIAVHFLCRYFSLNRHIRINFFHYAFLLAIILATCYGTCFINGYYMVLNAVTEKNANDLDALWIDFDQNPPIYARFRLDPVELIFESARYYDRYPVPPISGVVNRHDSIIGLWAWLFDNLILAVCGRQFVRYVKENELDGGLQGQLNSTLMMMAYCQLLFQAMFVLIYFVHLLIPLNNFALCWSVAIAWLPLLNTLACLFVFSPYREALIELIKSLASCWGIFSARSTTTIAVGNNV